MRRMVFPGLCLAAMLSAQGTTPITASGGGVEKVFNVNLLPATALASVQCIPSGFAPGGIVSCVAALNQITAEDFPVTIKLLPGFSLYPPSVPPSPNPVDLIVPAGSMTVAFKVLREKTAALSAALVRGRAQFYARNNTIQWGFATVTDHYGELSERIGLSKFNFK